jgi:pimeloyl-ACP methyl ester carboxylesterase
MRLEPNQMAHSAGESRFFPRSGSPVLVYLPGLHGDSTLFTSFRVQACKHVQVLEFDYPRSMTWSVEDHAEFVLQEVHRHNIESAWLLAESYGSQVAWSLAQRALDSSFCIHGIILAGGFVRYPFPALASVAERVLQAFPFPVWEILLSAYAGYAKFRHRHAPETKAAIDEFIRRRTPEDLAAMVHRLKLIIQNDPRAIARHVDFPVYLLAGAIDPVVLTSPVLRWLRRNCPSFSDHRIIWPADHNILATEPRKALVQILQWLGSRIGQPRAHSCTSSVP